MVRIVQLEGKAAQGKTLPLFCLGDDGHRYVAKGQNAGRLALIREWIAASIGTELGLPIPPFVQMELDPRLLDFDATGDAQLIGKITAFGSRRVENVDELEYGQVPGIDPLLRARILLFDWWISNADRILTAIGGNPNLLWNVPDKSLVVIDHNLAFDPDLCINFWNEHAFRADRPLWTPQFRAVQEAQMRAAMPLLPKIWSELPDDWIEVNCGIDLQSAGNLLWRFANDPATFWGAQ